MIRLSLLICSAIELHIISVSMLTYGINGKKELALKLVKLIVIDFNAPTVNLRNVCRPILLLAVVCWS